MNESIEARRSGLDRAAGTARHVLPALLAAALGACGEGRQPDRQPASTAAGPARGVAAVDTARIIAARQTPGDWLTHGGTYDEQRHSRLDDVNRDTVRELGVAWTYELRTARGVESTPIVVDGVMFVTSAWSVVHALDAGTGEELWVHEPDVDRAVGVNACCDVVNRGVAVYDGKVFVGVIDGRLQALDAETGELVWSTVTVDQSRPYTITGAPRVVDGKVLIGNGGAELGVRGYLSAYDADSGELVWRFYTVPNPGKTPDGAASDPAMADVANDTWGDAGAWTSDGGGGTVWDSIVYDDVNGNVIFGVGNGSPWNQRVRDPAGGDNLFLSSIVAVDAGTGTYEWHFQTTPGDTWDYTATQPIILADLPLGTNGAPRRVAMQAPKNGFFYVVDTATGEFVSGEAFVPVNWAEGLDARGRPIEVAAARDQSMPYAQAPGPLGAHNWHPMAFNPELGLAYIPAQEIPYSYVEDPRIPAQPAVWNTGVDMAAGATLEPPPLEALRASLKGRLIAWDPVTQTPRWTVEHANAWNGGVLSTAGGLVFQGRVDGTFAAYDAATGERLWATNVKAGALSGPATYTAGGDQHVAITTGWGSAFALTSGYAFAQQQSAGVGRVVAFKLGGTAGIPDPGLAPVDRTPPADVFGDTAMHERGAVHYARNCLMCHGVFAMSAGVLPDLRWSPITADAEAWNAIVLDGSLADTGMVAFDAVLTREESEAVRAYVLTQAHLAVGREAEE